MIHLRSGKVGTKVRGNAERSGEAGQVLVIFAFMIFALVLMLALSVDLGYAYGQRRLAQNLADNAAMAGSLVVAQRLGCPADDECVDDADVADAICDVASENSGGYAVACPSGVPSSDLDGDGREVRLSAEYVADDGQTVVGTVGNSGNIPPTARGVRVTPDREIPAFFAAVAGMMEQRIGASATALSAVLTTVNPNHPDFFPYAVWGGEMPPDCPSGKGCLELGSTVTYRSNDWDGDNITANNPNWTVGSNNFKGFLRVEEDYVSFNPPYNIVTDGGNAIGQEPIAALQQHYLSGEPILLPVIGEGHNPGHPEIKVIAFVWVKLTNLPGNPSQPWTGTIVGYSATGIGDTTGDPPDPDLPVVWVPRLIQ